jgi:hypothetical protein
MAIKATTKKATVKKSAKSETGIKLTRALCQPDLNDFPPCGLAPLPPVGAVDQILNTLNSYKPAEQNEILAAVLQAAMKKRNEAIQGAAENRSLAMEREDRVNSECKRLHEILQGSGPDSNIIPSPDGAPVNGVYISNRASKY